MAAETLHFPKGGKRVFNTLERFGEADPAEITRRYDRKQVNANIGRRGALRHQRPGIFLKIVRWQMIVFCGGEGFEIEPGTSGKAAQVAFIGKPDFERVLRSSRAADQPGDEWREQPDEAKGERHQCGRARQRHWQGNGGNAD